MVKQEKVFSFYLDHNYANDSYTNGSYLAIGYIPEDKVNKVTWVPVTNPNRWVIIQCEEKLFIQQATEIKEMKVGNKTVDLTPDANNTKDVLIDSGTSLLVLSDYVLVELVNQMTGFEYVLVNNKTRSYRCDSGYPEKYPNITIVVNGMDIILTAYNYLTFSTVIQQVFFCIWGTEIIYIEQDGKSFCSTAFLRAKLGVQILGDAFLKTNFVTFSKRNQTMGIYQ